MLIVFRSKRILDRFLHNCWILVRKYGHISQNQMLRLAAIPCDNSMTEFYYTKEHLKASHIGIYPFTYGVPGFWYFQCPFPDYIYYE